MTTQAVTVRVVTCPCGARFEASSPRAVYCSPRCRKRGSRAGVAAVPQKRTPHPAPEPPDLPDSVQSVTGSVVAELTAANALGSAAGLAAVKLAQLIDSATLMQGAAVAAWTREMRAALVEAKAGAPAAEADPLDELERRRAERRGA